MKTSTKIVQLPGLGLNAYEVDGRAYVSMSEIVKATRNNDDTRPLIKWLSGAQNFSDANGFQPFECNVSRAQGGTSVANLFSPAVAWHFILNDLTSTKAAIVARSLKLVQVVGAAGFETMTQEALGLRVSVTENLTAAVRLQADLTVKAPDIQRLKLAMYKAMVPHLGLQSTHDLPYNDLKYPIYKEIKKVVNSLYSRLDEGVLTAIDVVKKSTPSKSYKRPSKYSCLTEEARKALKPVINAYITGFAMLQTPGTALDVQRIIQSIDRVYPRYC
jgi:hypothetical protein